MNTAGRRRYLATALGTIFAFAVIGKADAADETITRLVPLYISNNRPIAMLRIGEHPPLPVVFDTGTDENIIDASVADHLKLRQVSRSPVVDLGSGKTEMVPLLKAEQAQIGGVPLVTTTVQKLAMHAGDETGIFGPASFGGVYVIVEAGYGRLRLVPKSAGFTPRGPGTPYRDNLPALTITLNGRPLSAHVDSGNSSELLLGGDLINSVALKEPAHVVGIAKSALATREIMGGQIDGVARVGPFALTDPEVSFLPSGNGANIGFPVLRHLTVVLDPQRKLSWVLDPGYDPPPMKDFAGQFGPRMIRIENGKLIHQREGRPAFELSYAGGDLFDIPATGDRIQFFRKDGRVVKLELITAEGDVVPAERTS